jgi:hypothetical protein
MRSANSAHTIEVAGQNMAMSDIPIFAMLRTKLQ